MHTLLRFLVAVVLVALPTPALWAQMPGGGASPAISVFDMMGAVEKELSLETDRKQPLKERLERAEIEAFGAVQEGGLAPRTQALYQSLVVKNDPNQLQSPVLQKGQAPALVHFKGGLPPAEAHYLDTILKATDGRVIRWQRFPLRLYVEHPDKKRLKDLGVVWNPAYEAAALDAVVAWQKALGDLGQFTQVKRAGLADIVLGWAEPDHTAEVIQEAAKHPDKYNGDLTTLKAPTRTPLVTALNIASGLTPGLFRLIPTAAAAGIAYRQNKLLEAVEAESQLAIPLPVLPANAQVMASMPATEPQAAEVASVDTDKPTAGVGVPQDLQRAWNMSAGLNGLGATPTVQDELSAQEPTFKLPWQKDKPDNKNGAKQAENDVEEILPQPDPNSPEAILVYNRALATLGYALGLKAPSDKPDDATHPSTYMDSTARKTPSARDVLTLQLLYARPADVVLNVR